MPGPTGFERFDPDCIEWLYRRHDENLPVTEADLIRLLEARRNCSVDPLLHKYLCQALEGKLKPAAGRPRSAWNQAWFTFAADGWVREERDKIRLERRGRRAKGDLDPTNEAANRVARDYWFVLGNISGRALLNRISQQKRRGFL